MRVLFFVVFVGGMLCTPVALKQLTHGFRFGKLRLEMSFRPDWELERGGEKEILQQPFFYLARGAQSYVFASQDGKYVLKLFRYDQPINPLRCYFRTWIRKGSAKTPFREKIERLFSGCILASVLKEETGFVYAHLNLTEGQLPTAELHIPLGRVAHLPLDRVRFALQKRVETAQEVFSRAYAAGDREKGKELVASLWDLLERRENKGVRNLDLHIGRNFGFVEGRAVEIDFGNYMEVGERGVEVEREQFSAELPRFLSSVAPDWKDL